MPQEQASNALKDNHGNILFDVETGIALTSNSSVTDVNKALISATLKLKELEVLRDGIKELIMPLAQDAADAGDKSFLNFWKLRQGNMKFNEKKFLKTATKEEVEEYKLIKMEFERFTKDEKYHVRGGAILTYPTL